MVAGQVSRSAKVQYHLHRVVHCPHIIECQVTDLCSQSTRVDRTNHLA